MRELKTVIQVVLGGIAGIILGLFILEWLQPGSAQHLLEAMK